MRPLLSRRVLVIVLLAVAAGYGEPCFSQDATYANRFFAIAVPPVYAPAPLFTIDPGDDAVGTAPIAPPDTAAQLQTDIRASQEHSLGNPFEPERSTLFRAAGVSMFASAAADLATTELGVAKPGIVESNPFQGSRGARIALHVAVPVFLYWATERARRKGHRKLALLMRIGVNIAFSYAAMHNARTLTSHP